jgi:predicted Zn-dependent protease
MTRLATLALLLVACGTPPTFQPVCRKGDVVTYEACAEPHIIKWALPIRVGLEPGLADYSDSLDMAINRWNGAVSMRLFMRVDGPADVTVSLGAVRKGIAGSVSHVYTGDVLSAAVRLHGVADVTVAYHVLTHELGHVVGLAHDQRPTSIMHEALDTSGIMGGEELPMYLIGSEDVTALEKLYATD